jgi:hypothetical protein
MNRAARRAEKFGKRNWQTRAIDPAGGLRVLERYVDSVTLLPEHKINDVQLLALASLDEITKGHGTAEHIGAISLACNMTGALIRQGIGEEATEIVERCQTALLNADRRFTKVGRWGFSGPELQHVRDLLDVHERMVSNASQLEVRRALRDIDERIARGEVLQRIAA